MQPYIQPSTELVDVVGKGNRNGNGNYSMPTVGKRSLGKKSLRNDESVRRYEMMMKRGGDGKRDFRPRKVSVRRER